MRETQTVSRNYGYPWYGDRQETARVSSSPPPGCTSRGWSAQTLASWL